MPPFVLSTYLFSRKLPSFVGADPLDGFRINLGHNRFIQVVIIIVPSVSTEPGIQRAGGGGVALHSNVVARHCFTHTCHEAADLTNGAIHHLRIEREPDGGENKGERRKKNKKKTKRYGGEKKTRKQKTRQADRERLMRTIEQTQETYQVIAPRLHTLVVVRVGERDDAGYRSRGENTRRMRRGGKKVVRTYSY